MLTIAISLTVLILLLGLAQIVVVWKFGRQFLAPASIEDVSFPKATILMALRGADPQLAETITRLVRQDYPDFNLEIIVDSTEDASWQIAHDTVTQLRVTNVSIHSIDNRRTTCGLQCSAFIEGATRVTNDTVIVVTVDGDLMAHPGMLRELIAPFSNESVGLTFGNRWFMPIRTNLGSLVRYCWNCAAVVPMQQLSIPWGGCMAVRKSLIDETDLLEKWAHAMVHDAPIKSLIESKSCQARFVPSLMMPIRESCNLNFALDFIKRQLTWTKLYHPGWSKVMIQALMTTSIPLAAVIFVFLAAILTDWYSAAIAFGSLVIYVSILWGLNLWMEAIVQTALSWRNERCQWMKFSTVLALPIAFVTAQLVHAVAVCMATFNRHLRWRGVVYRIDGPWDATILSDAPYSQVTDTDASL